MLQQDRFSGTADYSGGGKMKTTWAARPSEAWYLSWW